MRLRLEIDIPLPNVATFRSVRPWKGAVLIAVMLVTSLFLAQDSARSAGMNSITSPYTAGNAGSYTSLVLDSAGNPVIAFDDGDFSGVRVLRCGDMNCTSTSPGGFVPGSDASLALNAGGLVVVSARATGGGLVVMTCQNVACSSSSFVTYDPGTNVGSDSSLDLDAAGFPVVSYFDSANGDLKVQHCNHPQCFGGSLPTTPDSAGFVGAYTSLALDALGKPVVSYWDLDNLDLKVLHCNDVNCTGGDESIQSPDTDGIVGGDTSIVLDAAGRPVISYIDFTNGDLRVMHCNDANCAGGGESIQSPDTAGFVGPSTSLALDSAGRPVVSYWDGTNEDLKVMRCNDVNCAGGGESIQSPDTTGGVGNYTSLALDSLGRPVVAYTDATNFDVKLLHCGTANCNNSPTVDEIRVTSLTTGWPAGPMGGACYEFDPLDTADPTFFVCDNDTGVTIDASPRCIEDGSAACTDSEPVKGSISVAVLPGQYDVTTDSVPIHNPDAHLKSCNVAAGVDAKCTFTHTFRPPWFPWDLNGDHAVSGIDFFQLLGHFTQTK